MRPSPNYFVIMVDWFPASSDLVILTELSKVQVAITYNQWCIAKHGGGYTQKGMAYVYTVYPAYLWPLGWVYAVKKWRLVYGVYPRIPPNTSLPITCRITGRRLLRSSNVATCDGGMFEVTATSLEPAQVSVIDPSPLLLSVYGTIYHFVCVILN